MGQKSIIHAPATMEEAVALANRIAKGKHQPGDATRAARLFNIATRGNRRAVFMALMRALGETKNETSSLAISVVRHVAPKATVHVSIYPKGTAEANVMHVPTRRNGGADGIKGVTTGAAIIAALIDYMAVQAGLPYEGEV